MRCTIQLPASTPYLQAEAEHQIQSAHHRHGYDWTEIEAHAISGSGAVVHVFRWIPMAEAQRRIARGDVSVLAHFFASAPNQGGGT